MVAGHAPGSGGGQRIGGCASAWTCRLDRVPAGGDLAVSGGRVRPGRGHPLRLGEVSSSLPHVSDQARSRRWSPAGSDGDTPGGGPDM